jgi:ubiquinone/menaquinone biosynthesis C-methylase UbiE
MLTNLLHRVVARPVVYDLVQRLFGSERNLEKVRSQLAHVGAVTVLDVGGGTGNLLRVLPPEVQYLWLDNYPQKLVGLRRTGRPLFAILASATAMPLDARSIDVPVCIAMSHHLDDCRISELFMELSRVCRDRLIFLDAVERRELFLSRLLWKYDRRSYPRRLAVLRQLVQQRFQIEYEEEYTIYHSYWFCLGRVHQTAALDGSQR